MSSNVQLDPYVAEAQNNDVSPLQKIEGTVYTSWKSLRESHLQVDLNKIIQEAQTGMLTTRAPDGHLHTRAMTPAYREGPYIRVSLSYHLIAMNLQRRSPRTPRLASFLSQTTARPNSRKFKMTIT